MSLRKRRKVSDETFKPYSALERGVVDLLPIEFWIRMIQRSWNEYEESPYEFVNNLSMEEKVCKLKSVPCETLEEVLNSQTIKTLKRLTHIKSKRRRDLANAVACAFHGKICAFDARTIEQRALETKEGFGLTLCGRYLPPEIARHILSYHEDSDKKLLFSIGRICKELYLLILATWRTVVITRKNMKQISLLVMGSARCVIIWEPNDFMKSEYEYLHKHLKSVEELIIEPHFRLKGFRHANAEECFYKVFRNVKKITNDDSYFPLSNKFQLDQQRFEKLEVYIGL